MGDQIKVEGAAVPSGEVPGVSSFQREARSLYEPITKSAGGESWLAAVHKSNKPDEQASRQGLMKGQRLHPFNFELVGRFQEANVHHARSIHSKVSATVGLGFQTPNDKVKKDAKLTGIPPMPEDLPPEGDIARIDTILSPLCDISFQDLLNDVCEDYWQTGNGYIEVVRDGERISGLHHIPSRECYVVIEDDRHKRHFLIEGAEDATGRRVFACFGDKEDMISRLNAGGLSTNLSPGRIEPDQVSEVIHFRRPTSLSRWYGYPDWLSAVASIELAQCVTQHEYDFFLNRGVPEFMLFILGSKLSKGDRDKIDQAMKATIGLANQHKSMLVNLAGESKVQLEKLAMESKSDGSQFSSLSETLALQIVSAHGVPPLLAGIQIPGKLGAANEMVQAMQAFQTLVIEPAQRLFRQTLLWSLGQDPALGLTAADLVLNTVTDEIDVQMTDTIARMRQTPQEAAAEGRDLEDGLLKGEDSMTDEEKGELIKAVTDHMLDRLILKSA